MHCKSFSHPLYCYSWIIAVNLRNNYRTLDMNKILCFATVLLMACGSTPAHQTTGDASSVEEAAVSHLYYVLNSDTGHVMTASELENQKSGNGIFKIDLPIDESNELPLFETIYIDDATGSRIVFHQETIEGDTIQPIGTADFRTVIHDWQKQAPDTTINYRVHARGNGLYTFYNIKHKGCHCQNHDKHPDGFPEYVECIVWIKPDSKELLITWGYKRSERTYHVE